MRLDIAGDIDADDAAGFKTALDTGAGAELSVESGLAGWTGGRGHVEGVAAGCGGADAAEVGDLPGPWCGAGDGCCGGGGGEKSEGGDFGEHGESGWFLLLGR